MDFLLWAVRGLHVFGVVAWLGGLMYQEVVTIMVARAEGPELGSQVIHMLRRFGPFIWMYVWIVLVTGVALMMFSTRFVFLEFENRWSMLLALKQLVFLLMVFFSFGYARMNSRLREVIGSGDTPPLDKAIPYYHQIRLFGRINIALGITALLLAAAMR